MSRRWETYRAGNTIRLRRVDVPAPKSKKAKAEPAVVVDLTTATKADLVAEAEARGVDSSGTKAEILERLDG